MEMFFSFPCRIGIDQIILSPRINHIAWQKLFDATSSSEKATNIKVIQAFHVSQALDLSTSDAPFGLVKEITIFHKNNVLKLLCDKNGKSSYRLTLNLPSLPERNCMHLLGNLYNHTVKCSQKYARTIMYELEEHYGIGFNYKTAQILKIEINVNLVLPKNIKPSQIINYFKPLCNTSKHYTYKTVGMQSCKEYSLISPAQTNPVPLNSNEITLLEFPEKKPEIKVYNKSYDVLSQQPSDLSARITDIDSIIRVEYVFRRQNQITNYLGTTDYFDLSQSQIEEAFRKYTREHIRKPLKKFDRTVNRLLEEYFSSIEINSNRNWRNNFLNTLWRILADYNISNHCISYDELLVYVGCLKGKSIQHNKMRIVSTLIELLNSQGGSSLSITNQKKPYEELTDFLCNIEDKKKQHVYFTYS